MKDLNFAENLNIFHFEKNCKSYMIFEVIYSSSHSAKSF